MKRSQAHIVGGQVQGVFTEWHENGQKAVEMNLVAGVAEGPATAWHPSGALKSRSRMEKGQTVDQEFFPDTAAAGEPAAPAVK